MAKINRYNKQGQQHGLWDEYGYKCHFVNGYHDGYYDQISNKCYFRNKKLFGVELQDLPFSYYLYQFFWKQNNKFGEQLDWRTINSNKWSWRK